MCEGFSISLRACNEAEIGALTYRRFVQPRTASVCQNCALRRSLNVILRRTQRRSADQRPVQELAELLPRHVPVPELADNRPLPLALRLPLLTRTWTKPLL